MKAIVKLILSGQTLTLKVNKVCRFSFTVAYVSEIMLYFAPCFCFDKKLRTSASPLTLLSCLRFCHHENCMREKRRRAHSVCVSNCIELTVLSLSVSVLTLAQPPTQLCRTTHCFGSLGQIEKWLCPTWRRSSPSTQSNKRTQRSRRGQNDWRKTARRKRYERIWGGGEVYHRLSSYQYTGVLKCMSTFN